MENFHGGVNKPLMPCREALGLRTKIGAAPGCAKRG
jgi:hypothetical protein